MIYSKKYYLDKFNVDESLLESLAGEGLRYGGDFSDLYFENSTFNDLMLKDGEVSSGGFHIDYGVVFLKYHKYI